jgi:hypothetical protein
MITKSYQATINYLGENAPTLDKPGAFIKWAEDIAELLSFIYSVPYDDITTDLTDAAKDIQGWEDED